MDEQTMIVMTWVLSGVSVAGAAVSIGFTVSAVRLYRRTRDLMRRT